MMYLGNNPVGIATKKELSGFFEVVHRFTPTEDEARHTMPNFGIGSYIFCEDPILTTEKAVAEQYPNYSLVAGQFIMYNNTTGYYRGISLVTKTGGVYDYWGTYADASADSITFGTSSSNSAIGQFRAGHNYVVFKTILLPYQGGDT